MSEAELDAMCDVLWSSEAKGAVSIVGKIVHQRQRPPVFQTAVKLSDSEGQLFRRLLGRARALAARDPR